VSETSTQPAARVFLVTGSGRGLGAEIARAAAAAGARVVLNCRKDRAAAGRLVDELRGEGAEVLACRADVTDANEARELVEETLRAYGRVDVLVNTVGGFGWHSVAETGPEEWRSILSSNLDSVFNMCQLVLPHMRSQRAGRIVNLASVGAERAAGEARVAAYAAAKAAVVSFSRSLAVEEGRAGVTVNVVAPGLLRDGREANGVPPGSGTAADRVPVGRSCEAADVARAVLYLASPEASFVTGQVLAVAGGWRL